jgi:hypothetical protein
MGNRDPPGRQDRLVRVRLLNTRDVRLLNVVVADFEATSQYHDELMRELQLIQASGSADGRLADLTRTLVAEFSGFAPAIRDAVDEAADRGEQRVDIAVRVPADLRFWLVKFRDHFREIDVYCQGGHLLTLGSPMVAVAFREWFLGQFISQLDGEEPSPYC